MHVNEKVLCVSKDGSRIGYKKMTTKITNYNHIFKLIKPSTPRKHSSDDNECTICCAEFGDSGVYTTKCGHKFHLGCIVPWYLKHTSCPLCREEDIRHPLIVESSSNQ